MGAHQNRFKPSTSCLLFLLVAIGAALVIYSVEIAESKRVDHHGGGGDDASRPIKHDTNHQQQQRNKNNQHTNKKLCHRAVWLSKFYERPAPKELDWTKRGRVVNVARGHEEGYYDWPYAVAGLLEGLENIMFKVKGEVRKKNGTSTSTSTSANTNANTTTTTTTTGKPAPATAAGEGEGAGSSPVRLSEQQLLDCIDIVESKVTPPHQTLLQLQSMKKIAPESEYKVVYYEDPMEGNYECQELKDESKLIPLGSYLGPLTLSVTRTADATGQTAIDEDHLKLLLANYGPVIGYLDLEQLYSETGEGKYKPSYMYMNKRKPKSCHKADGWSVLIVGYGTNSKGQDYWLAKNWLGKDWGDEGGYFRALRNPRGEFKKKVCPSFPKVTLATYKL